MIFNEQNILNRTVLARCCFADMVIDMLEARAIGDTEMYECKKRKAMFLSYAINEMCTYIDEGVYTLNQSEDTGGSYSTQLTNRVDSYSTSTGAFFGTSLNQIAYTGGSCFKDSTAKKFLAQMDELCGCPCGCSPSKILDDNLPKYI